MIARTKARSAGLPVVISERDVIADGFGVRVDAVFLFNILHHEQPIELLQQAASALRHNGEVLVVHWCYGETPRGPSLDIRPKPEQIIDWAAKAGLKPRGEVIDLPPWHYGIRLQISNGRLLPRIESFPGPVIMAPHLAGAFPPARPHLGSLNHVQD